MPSNIVHHLSEVPESCPHPKPVLAMSSKPGISAQGLILYYIQERVLYRKFKIICAWIRSSSQIFCLANLSIY